MILNFFLIRVSLTTAFISFSTHFVINNDVIKILKIRIKKSDDSFFSDVTFYLSNLAKLSEHLESLRGVQASSRDEI